MVALGINVLLVGISLGGAILFHSAALLADAGHVLSDLGAIVLALLAAGLAARPATGRRTFGLRRSEILAALVNGLVLAALAVLVVVESARRLPDPPDVEGAGVLAAGLVGFAGNVAATVVLARGDRRDLNLEGVLRHSAADALGSFGVIVAGAVVLSSGWREADPIAGILIGVLILAGSWRLIREPLDVLMETAPAGIDVAAIGAAMAAVPGVREVHDLHVWTVTSGFPALSAHVLCEPGEDADGVRRRLEALLGERFEIEHTTIQAMTARLLELEDRRGGAMPPAEG